MNTLYPLHSLLRRNMALVEHFIAAAGLALMCYGLTWALPVYPLYWDGVIAAAVFGLTLISPVAGYFAAVAAMTYPLYTVSIYIAVLFLAIAILGQHAFINNLGATLLTFASPILGSIYLAWGAPLLGGLWWGPAGGALMGAVGALWGLIVAGLAGLAPDWMNLYGVLPVFVDLPQRFAQANSIQALRALFLPLMPTSTYFLYCLLQVGSWAFVGWAVGMFAEKDWALYHRPRSSMVIVLGGASTLALLQVLLSLWLGVPAFPFSYDLNLALGATTLLSALAAMFLEWGEDFLEHPLPIPRSEQKPARAPRVLVEEQPEAAPQPNAAPAESAGEAPAPREIPKTQDSRKSDDEDNLIMLELD